MKFFSSNQRTNKARIHILYMFLIKACNIVINLAYVPLLISSLNADKYGIWLTITTIVSWIAFFDIGFGNGLRNKLASSFAQNDIESARKYVTTTYVSMAGLCLFFIIIELLIIPFCNWNLLLNAYSISNRELIILMLWVISCLCIQMILKLLNSILYALQRPAMASLILMGSQLLAFTGVFFYSIIHENATLLELGIIISTAPIIVFVLASYYLFKKQFPQLIPKWSYFDKTIIKETIILGNKFFLIQITSLLLFQSNNFIIAHTCGNASVAEYNIGYKYMGIIEMVFMIIMTPFWSATTEAYAKKDYQWIKTTLKQLRIISYCLVIVGGILILISSYAYDFWLSSAIKPDKMLLFLLLIYFTIQLSWARYGNIINGIGYVKLQFYITLIEAIIHIPMALLLGKTYGIRGVLLSLIISTCANTIWPQIQIKKIFSEAPGIWKK